MENKNLANCKPKEFLKQTYKIKQSVQKWLTDTDVMNIRKHLPEMIKITDGMTADQKESAQKENEKRINDQIMKNGMSILDSMLDTHADETLEILALCCFVEPSDIDNYSMSYYLSNIADLLSDPGVVSFFTSLARLVRTNMPSASEQ